MKKIKSVVRSIGKEIKRFAKSDLGKFALAAATIYVGGAALGAWKAAGPLAKVNGILRAGSAAAGAGGASTAASGTLGASAGVGASAGTAATGAIGAGATAGGTSAAASTAGKGIISAMMEGAKTAVTNTGAWAMKHPLSAATALSAAGSMASPDEIDIMREREKEDAKRRAREDANLQVGSIDMGGPTGPRTPLQWRSSQLPIFQGGIINSNRGVV